MPIFPGYGEHEVRPVRAGLVPYLTSVLKDDFPAKAFYYIETWYNRKRRHSTLGYLSPAEYERRAVLGSASRPGT